MQVSLKLRRRILKRLNRTIQMLIRQLEPKKSLLLLPKPMRLSETRVKSECMTLPVCQVTNSNRLGTNLEALDKDLVGSRASRDFMINLDRLVGRVNNHLVIYSMSLRSSSEVPKEEGREALAQVKLLKEAKI